MNIDIEGSYDDDSQEDIDPDYYDEYEPNPHYEGEEEKEITDYLRKQIINSIESYKFEEEKTESTCLVCQDIIKTNSQVKKLLCKHLFHSKCINGWLKHKLKCPTCKHKVTLKNSKGHKGK